MFFKHAGVRDSNESEVLAIFEALRIYSHEFSDRLPIESDGKRFVQCYLLNECYRWLPLEILLLFSIDQVAFCLYLSVFSVCGKVHEWDGRFFDRTQGEDRIAPFSFSI